MSKPVFNHKTDYMTVPEFAKAAGVSPQAIYKRLNNSRSFMSYAAVIDGTKVISRSALSVFYDTEPEPEPEVIELQNGQYDLIQLLKEQLQAKDKQIADLTEALINSQKLQGAMATRIALLEDQQAQQAKEDDLQGVADVSEENKAVVQPLDWEQQKPDQQDKQEKQETLWQRFKKRFFF